MAPGAFHLNMLAGQDEFSGVMVEFGRRPPAVKSMAGQATASKLAAMFVPMAALTILPEAQKSPLRIAAGCFEFINVGYILCLMALTAFQLGVFTFQAVAHLSMVKGLHAVGPMDQISRSAQMLDMAQDTIVMPRERVEPLACVYSLI